MQKRTPTAEVLGMLGLAKRAGMIAAGTDRTRRALRAGEARLVLVAGDASAVQLRKIDGLIRRDAIPRAVIGDRISLGAAVGEAPLSAVAVTNARFAEQMLQRLTATVPTEPEFK